VTAAGRHQPWARRP